MLLVNRPLLPVGDTIAGSSAGNVSDQTDTAGLQNQGFV